MPTYVYGCLECGRRMDTVCRYADRPEYLKCVCGGRMEVVLDFRGRVGRAELDRTYYPAFGKRLTRQELKNEIRVAREERGQDIVEVGNEREYMSKQKTPTFKPDVKAAYHALRKANG